MYYKTVATVVNGTVFVQWEVKISWSPRRCKKALFKRHKTLYEIIVESAKKPKKKEALIW